MLLLVQVLCASFVAQAHWLTSEAELRAEFCPTSWPLDDDTCEAPRAPVAKLMIPPRLGHVIEAHVRAARERGYYRKLSMDDFYHGHLILRGPKTEFRDADELFDNVSLLLYHTAEHDGRWEGEVDRQVPVAERTPRSLLGFLDGRLEPATRRVRDLPPNFAGSGTLHERDILGALPDASTLDYTGARGIPDVYVRVDGEACQVDTQEFYVLPEDGGRYRDPTGHAIELYLRCVQNPEHAVVPYFEFKRSGPSVTASGF